MSWCAMKLIWCRLWYSPASKKVHRLYRLATESCHGAPQSCYNANSGTALPATVCIYDRLLTESCHGALQSCYHANPGTDLLAKRYACIINCWPSRVTVKVATMQTLVQTCSRKNKKGITDCSLSLVMVLYKVATMQTPVQTCEQKNNNYGCITDCWLGLVMVLSQSYHDAKTGSDLLTKTHIHYRPLMAACQGRPSCKLWSCPTGNKNPCTYHWLLMHQVMVIHNSATAIQALKPIQWSQTQTTESNVYDRLLLALLKNIFKKSSSF